MAGGILAVSRKVKLFPLYKKNLEMLGVHNVVFTNSERIELNKMINEVKPCMVLFDSRFYEAGTSLMIGQLLITFPYLNIAVINIQSYPVNGAPYFIWRGAKSYVDLDEGWEEFARGMKTVIDGEEYISPTVKKLIDEVEWPDMNDKAVKRQMEVLVYICNGKKAEEIANLLFVSRRTIDWHMNELFKVFDVDNQVQLSILAVCLDVVTKEDISFYDRKKLRKTLPDWALKKQELAMKK